LLILKSKDCEDEKDKYVKVDVPESYVVKKISSVLHFTAEDTLKPSFDVLIASKCETIECLIEYAEKKFREDVGLWIVARLEILRQFLNGAVMIPTCLQDYDEIVKRMVVGLLYAIRPKMPPVPVVMDDTLSFVVNKKYASAFVAMMRPFKVSVNEFLETRDMLKYNPVIIAPGGHGGEYRLARPDKYVIIFDHSRWEIPRREIEQIANS
jgi:hypothetical protein